MSTIILTSPLRGWATSLDEVPDPVFAGRMLGDGIAIEPMGSVLHAPCDGQVIALPASCHAITLRSPEGVEVLMHIGVDTVALKGQGFDAKVAEGDLVQRGDPLIEFDLDALLPLVPSVTTPILVSNSDQFEIVHRDVGKAISVGERMLTLIPREPPRDLTQVDGDEHRRSIVVPMVHGIHARPAGRIVECARGFQSDISFRKSEKSANARSAVSMLTLGVKLSDTIEVVAKGPDAEEALVAVCELIGSGMGEGADGAKPTSPRRESIAPSQPPPSTQRDGRIVAVVAAPGLAVGQAVWLRDEEYLIPERGTSPTEERHRLEIALGDVSSRFQAATGTTVAVLEAHRALIGDPELLKLAHLMIDSGASAELAWRDVLRRQASLLKDSGDARLAERADDLLDVERQVLAALTGRELRSYSFPPNTILLAYDLLPSDLIHIGPGGIAGFCTTRGGPTSHVAILAASMGIPGLVAAGPALASVTEGTDLILDARTASLTITPSAAEMTGVQTFIASEKLRKAEALAQAHRPAETQDGAAIEVFANLASIEDAHRAIEYGAEGCGLLRTEFLFLDRPTAPDEDEQAAEYQDFAHALQGKPLIIRLLDVGGDKPACYLPIEHEENPALGLRGIRVGLARPDILMTQLRAILRTKPIGQCRIMIPMVASVAELLAVREALDAARSALNMSERIELGVMIETPAAAITADLIAEHADFLSIGTNDLTQYVLAMDRGNPAVAAGIDAFHPAVLRMIAQTCDGARRHGRWTGMCGGMASDPLAAPILIGLGISELSVTTNLVPDIKHAVRRVSIDACRALAGEALSQSSPGAVRSLAQRFQQELTQ